MPVYSTSGDFFRAACFLQAKNLWVLSRDSAIELTPFSGLNHNNAISGRMGIAMSARTLDNHEDGL